MYTSKTDSIVRKSNNNDISAMSIATRRKRAAANKITLTKQKQNSTVKNLKPKSESKPHKTEVVPHNHRDVRYFEYLKLLNEVYSYLKVNNFLDFNDF